MKAGGNYRPAWMILNCHYRSFFSKCAIVALDEHAVSEFQRLIDCKQDFTFCPKLDDGVLNERFTGFADVLIVVGLVIIADAIATVVNSTKLDRNSHRCGIGKKSCQTANNVRFKRTRDCLVRQNYDLGPKAAAKNLEQSSPSLPGLEEHQEDSRCVIGIPRCTLRAINLKVMHLRASHRKGCWLRCFAQRSSIVIC